MDNKDSDKLRARMSELTAEYPTGSLWRHYRNGVYEIVSVCLYKGGLVPMIVYRGQDGIVWSQFERKFRELVVKDSRRRPRFVRVMEQLTEASDERKPEESDEQSRA